MQSYLGLYIEDNLIKYAKLSKEKEKIKIDSFGVKFNSNIKQAIQQIIDETYSYKTPISVNLTEEKYQYFNMFSLLNKKDLEKAVKLEFEAYCAEKDYNSNSLDTRYVVVNNSQDKEKIKIINISENKIELNKIKQRFEGYKLGTMVPVSMTVPNLLNLPQKENVLIVNIEAETTITTIVDKNIFNVEKIEEGSREILEKINLKENSYSRAFEICKNTTIYTSDAQYFVEEQSKYLEDIMPTLYNIVGKVQKIINESTETISKVYITGTLASVNNIDLYFQEYLGKVKCEILKPYFIQNMVKEMNIKEYIEVNTAISLALQGLGEGIDGINFKKQALGESLLNIKIGNEGKKGKRQDKKSNNILNKINFNFDDFGEEISKKELSLLRCTIAIAIFIIIYSGFSTILINQIKNKQEETDNVITQINSQISKVNKDTSTLNSKTTKYTTLISDLQEVNDKVSDIKKSKNLIPNLLNQIMSVIDQSVQITSIQNTTGKHIVIKAQSTQYPGLGYFKAKLETKNILKDVVSGAATKQNDIITVTIEGDLP